MRLFGYDITVRKHRQFKPYTPRPMDTLTMGEVQALRKRIAPAAPLPNGTHAMCYAIQRGRLSYPATGAQAFAQATVRPFRSLDTLEWAWALDNPVEEPAHAAKD